MKVLLTVIRILVSLLLFYGIYESSDEYHSILLWLVLVTAAILAFWAYKIKMKGWMWIFIIVGFCCVFDNPFYTYPLRLAGVINSIFAGLINIISIPAMTKLGNEANAATITPKRKYAELPMNLMENIVVLTLTILVSAILILGTLTIHDNLDNNIVGVIIGGLISMAINYIIILDIYNSFLQKDWYILLLNVALLWFIFSLLLVYWGNLEYDGYP